MRLAWQTLSSSQRRCQAPGDVVSCCESRTPTGVSRVEGGVSGSKSVMGGKGRVQAQGDKNGDQVAGCRLRRTSMRGTANNARHNCFWSCRAGCRGWLVVEGGGRVRMRMLRLGRQTEGEGREGSSVLSPPAPSRAACALSLSPPWAEQASKKPLLPCSADYAWPTSEERPAARSIRHHASSDIQ